ncbi:MAG: carboxypeptidase-like regulatory domain-containing protein, partial [Terriglobales bacterium]
MRRSIKIAVLLFTIAGLFAAVAPSWGQEVTAGITGTVLDPSGAPIAGAEVTAKDLDLGTIFTTNSDNSGVFNITRMPVGRYSVTATASGFDTAVYHPFTLVLNQIANVKFDMKIGQLAQVVEVTGAAPILQTQTTEVSTLIDANTNVSLPLASRNYLQLTLLAPGVTNVDPDGMRQPQSMLDSGRPYINGNREQANEFLLDGQLNSEDKNNETAYQPGIDAIQEFNLITQNGSAEFGNYEGGVVSATVKSGTNNFHVDVFEFLRNDKFDANN